MYYLEHCLREAGVGSVDTATLLRTSDEEWVYRDLRAELLDLFPHAQVTTRSPDAATQPADLFVAPLTDTPAFPQQDVAYGRLRDLSAWSRRIPRGCPVVVYRAEWREAEVVKPNGLEALCRRKRLELLAVRVLGRAPLLRRFLRPLH